MAEFPPSGDLLVKGIPGSGKTLTIVARAVRLAGMPLLAPEPGVPLVRVFTFNRLLTEWIRFLASKLGAHVPEVTTFHSWANKALAELGEHSVEFDDMAGRLDALARARKGLPAGLRAHHVLVDEAQDLRAADLQIIKKSAITSFTVAADRAQTIYESDFTWKSIGINIRGSRSRTLDRSLRNTKQIARLVAPLARNDPAFDVDDLVSDVDALPDGPIPELWVCSSFAKADEAVRRAIASAKADMPKGTIAILHPNKKATYAIAKAYGARVLDAKTPDMITPGVIASTIHGAKGLEFDTVIVKDISEGVLPAPLKADQASNVLSGDNARRLLYVACTRAKQRLVIVTGSKPSPLISELDRDHYRRTNL